MGQPDIAGQLPGENSTFKQVNKEFKNHMTRVNKERNAFRALVQSQKDFIKVLAGLNK